MFFPHRKCKSNFFPSGFSELYPSAIHENKQLVCITIMNSKT